MKAKKKKKEPEKFDVQVGSLLLAKPFWEDEVFVRAAVLITYIDNDKILGIIINKMSTVEVKDALPEINTEEHVFFGGNKNSMEISYLHTMKDFEDAVPLGNGIFWGGDSDRIIEMSTLNSINFKKMKFIAGFNEWTPAKLKKEFKKDKWWLTSLTAKELFDSPPETLWSYKLLQSGHTYGLFAHIPDPAIKETVAAGFNIN